MNFAPYFLLSNNLINLSDYYVEHQVIDEVKNQVFSWSDTLSDDGISSNIIFQINNNGF